jgi:hypothetical protein
VIGGCGPGALFELKRVELRLPPTAAAASPNSSGPPRDLPTRRWQAEGWGGPTTSESPRVRPAATWPHRGPRDRVQRLVPSGKVT